MKILITTPIFPPHTGGPATYVWGLVNRLKSKHKIKIICFSEKPHKMTGTQIIPISEKGTVFNRQNKLFKAVFQESLWADISL